MSDRIRGRVAIVTGASRGIGEHIARQLHRGGAKVVLAARDQAKLDALSRDLPGSLVVRTDVGSFDDCDALVARTVEQFGRVEILVNNAGVGITGLVSDVNLDDLMAVFKVNVFGAVRLIQACVPHMRQRQFGHIVNISSILGKRAVPQTAGYAASKFALQALSDGLRVEERPHGIVTTVICPGSTETEFRANEFQSGSILLEKRPRVNVMTAQRAAEITLEAIAKKKREVILTPFARFLDAVERVSPAALDLVFNRAYHKP